MPMALSPRLALGDEVTDPRGVGIATLDGFEFAVGLAVLVLALPPHRDLAKAGLLQQLAQLRQCPQPPVVGKRTFDFRAVGEAETDVAAVVAADRIVVFLLPEVGEAL